MTNKLIIEQGKELKLSDLSDISGFSQKSLRNYSSVGHLPVMKSARFLCGIETIKKLIHYLRDKDSDIETETNKQKLKLISARTRSEDAKADRNENKVVDITLVDEVWVSISNDIRSTLLASTPRLLQELNNAKSDNDREKIVNKNFENALNKLASGGSENILSRHEKILEEEENDETTETKEED